MGQIGWVHLATLKYIWPSGCKEIGHFELKTILSTKVFLSMFHPIKNQLGFHKYEVSFISAPGMDDFVRIFYLNYYVHNCTNS